MSKFSFSMLLAVVLFSACNNPSFRKGKDGIEYKIITDGNGQKVKYGNYMQLHFARYYNTGTKDSLLDDSRDQGPAFIEKLDTASSPAAYFDILRRLRKGDSVVVRIKTDSIINKSQGQVPPFMKKGRYILTTLKLLNIFTTKEQADSARGAAILEAQHKDSLDAAVKQQEDEKTLLDYFAKNKIKAQKAPLGTFVEIVQPGTGNNIDTSSIVSVNYTGMLLDGKIFDSNTDPSRGYVYPLIANFTNDSDPKLGIKVIKGWMDGMTMLNKGARAKIFIPSPLAYGKQQMGPDIAPNSILLFNVEIVDVMDKTRARVAVETREKKMQEMQKHYLDSIQKKNADTLNKKK